MKTVLVGGVIAAALILHSEVLSLALLLVGAIRLLQWLFTQAAKGGV